MRVMKSQPVRTVINAADFHASPEAVLESLRGLPGVGLLLSGPGTSPPAKYSYVAAQPFLAFRSFGARCELVSSSNGARVQFGNPWHLLEILMGRYEVLDELDLPFPLGGCFGYWGYDLKNFVEPSLKRHAIDDLELPDSQLGFYDSLVVFDHTLGKTWIISTGLAEDGSRNEARAQRQLEIWQNRLRASQQESPIPQDGRRAQQASAKFKEPGVLLPTSYIRDGVDPVCSSLSRRDFLTAVQRAQRYIQAGDIYQVSLAQRLAAPWPAAGWDLFQKLQAVSPSSFSAFLDYGDFQIVSSSPELFLYFSGSHVLTRPIKGTRPRHAEPTRDAQLSFELQTSPKELAELVMITDLLRNDLGRVCEYGSVQVPELLRLERYPQVQHLVATVEGRLRDRITHSSALAQCFPGGSVTGAPKIRAMEIIDDLEPVARGPYTGCLGYLGFNRESQLSIIIRAAVCQSGWSYFHVGAGIVADSEPEAEYEETLAKAAGFVTALRAAH